MLVSGVVTRSVSPCGYTPPMSKPYNFIHVGTGGHGGRWCRNFLPPNVADGLIQPVAAVDVNPEHHHNASEGLGLPADRLYTDLALALDENDADFINVVVPPAHHEAVIMAGVERGLHILSEKPIADDLASACRIADAVRDAGLKMGVTMSHRYREDITTLRTLIRSGEVGELDYLVCRFTCDMRYFGSWGAAFRHEIPDTLMVEGAVHHLDLLADLLGAKCESLYAKTWNPRWSEFQGDANGLVLMTAENGKHATYEGAKNNAVGLNCWGREYIRAECEGATLIMAHGKIERFDHDRGKRQHNAQPGEGVEVPMVEQPKWANTWLIEQFAHWLDEGEPMETHVEANLQSMALIAAAIRSSQTGEVVRVQEMLAEARRENVR